MGYDVDEKTGEVTKKQQPKKQQPQQTTSTSKKSFIDIMSYASAPGYTPPVVQETMNKAGQQIAFANPALALVNRKLHGLVGISATYDAIPDDQRDVLSDQNYWMFNNWNTVFSQNLNKARDTLQTNQTALKKAQQEGNTKEIEKLQKEIENNKKSIQNISDNYQQVKRAGGLEAWLKNNPGKKMVMGGKLCQL